MPGPPKAFVDTHRLSEDQRIQLIGDHVIATGETVCFVVDEEGDDGFEKADRYIAKLKGIYPAIRIHQTVKGPTKGAVTVQVSL